MLARVTVSELSEGDLFTLSTRILDPHAKWYVCAVNMAAMGTVSVYEYMPGKPHTEDSLTIRVDVESPDQECLVNVRPMTDAQLIALFGGM